MGEKHQSKLELYIIKVERKSTLLWYRYYKQHCVCPMESWMNSQKYAKLLQGGV